MRLFVYLFIYGLTLEKCITDQIYPFEILDIDHIQIQEIPFQQSTYRFAAFGVDYLIYLKEEVAVLNSGTMVFYHRDNMITQSHLRNIPHASIYSGYELGEDSFIVAYNNGHTINAHFAIRKNVYYLTVLLQDEGTGTMYNIKDVYIPKQHKDVNQTCESFPNHNTSYKHYNHFELPSYKLPSSKGKSKINSTRFCSLELVADHTYFQSKHSSHRRIISEMLYHIRIAQEIFGNSDIDGFRVEKITIFETKNESGYPFAEETEDSRKFLENLSKYKHPYCLLICFCHRPFWTEQQCITGDVTKIGSACDNSASNNDEKRNNNVIFITDTERDYIIPDFIVTLNLVHLLGHAFGCGHDPINTICSPGVFDSDQGNFIMYPYSADGKKLNNWKFSSCCLNSMKKVIEAKEKCFKKFDSSSCGNGIVEVGETCDCGNSSSFCADSWKCCTQPESRLQCTVREGKSCNPETGQCCDKSCNIVSSTEKRICFSNKPCWNVTTLCDGKSAFCQAFRQPDDTPCLDKSGKCKNGECITDICESHGLTSCNCTLSKEECYVCCKNEMNNCKTAKDHNINLPKFQLYVRPEGTTCSNTHGRCNSNGICLVKDALRSYSWVYFIPLPFIVLMMIVFYIFIVRRMEKHIFEVERQVNSSKS